MKIFNPVFVIVNALVFLACGEASEHLSISDIPIPPAAIEVRDRSGIFGPTDAVSYDVKSTHRSLAVIDFYDKWATDIGWNRLSSSDDEEVSVDWEEAIEPRRKRKVLRYRAVWLSLDGSQKLTVIVTCDLEPSPETVDIQRILVMSMKNRSKKRIDLKVP